MVEKRKPLIANKSNYKAAAMKIKGADIKESKKYVELSV
jgi:hypothetical protein